MSTIKAANVQNTGSGAPTFKNSSGTEIGQLAKAWVNFNGTGTIAIRDDFNVTSLTDNGTGSYTVNLTNNMNDTNYIVVTSISNSTITSQSSETSSEFSQSLRTTGSFRIRGGNTESNGNVDFEGFNVVVFGS